MPSQILTINSGSSSVKFALYDTAEQGGQVVSGALERIGRKDATFHARGRSGEKLIEEVIPMPDHDAAVQQLLAFLPKQSSSDLAAVGHRLVFGGREHTKPVWINAQIMKALRGLACFAPEHLPTELKAVEAVSRAHPGLQQAACFDTAFYSAMPKTARMFALPRDLFDEGIIRYGFHGLSYEYILSELAKEAGPRAAQGRVIMAHLGNGASMTAVKNGLPVDTTMGLTPAGGLMMGTRSGDLDPGVMLYLLDEKNLPPAALREMLNRKSGLLGVSAISSDMQDLLGKRATEPRADEAIALYCHNARKFLGALASVLGGVDIVVFTGGIGENAAAVRNDICEGLQFLGIDIDQERNAANSSVISKPTGRVAVRVIKTDEEGIIARHTRDLLAEASPSPGKTA